MPTTKQQDTGAAAGVPTTNEERLRALTSDRKPKASRTTGSAPADTGRRQGDLVDAVRERSRDTGRDTPG